MEHIEETEKKRSSREESDSNMSHSMDELVQEGFISSQSYIVRHRVFCDASAPIETKLTPLDTKVAPLAESVNEQNELSEVLHSEQDLRNNSDGPVKELGFTSSDSAMPADSKQGEKCMLSGEMIASTILPPDIEDIEAPMLSKMQLGQGEAGKKVRFASANPCYSYSDDGMLKIEGPQSPRVIKFRDSHRRSRRNVLSSQLSMYENLQNVASVTSIPNCTESPGQQSSRLLGSPGRTPKHLMPSQAYPYNSGNQAAGGCDVMADLYCREPILAPSGQTLDHAQVYLGTSGSFCCCVAFPFIFL